MVYFMENPIKMDDLGGFPPIFGNTHISPSMIRLDLQNFLMLRCKRTPPRKPQITWFFVVNLQHCEVITAIPSRPPGSQNTEVTDLELPEAIGWQFKVFPIHPGKLTTGTHKKEILEEDFQGSMLRFYVNFQGVRLVHLF